VPASTTANGSMNMRQQRQLWPGFHLFHYQPFELFDENAPDLHRARPRAAEERLHPRSQPAGLHRLENVVVGAGREHFGFTFDTDTPFAETHCPSAGSRDRPPVSALSRSGTAHDGHGRRTSRCARMPRIDDATRNGWIPGSIAS